MIQNARTYNRFYGTNISNTRRCRQGTIPLSPTVNSKEQKKDKKLLKHVEKNKSKYGFQTIEDAKLIIQDKKIFVPTALRQRIIAWYHEYLVHPGTTRMEATLKQPLTWPNLRKDVEQYI